MKLKGTFIRRRFLELLGVSGIGFFIERSKVVCVSSLDDLVARLLHLYKTEANTFAT